MKVTASRTAVRRLAIARLISIAGGAAAYTALMFTIYRRTHSPAWLSATLFLTFGVSGFVSPLGGWIGDHFDRRKVMIVSDLLGVGAFSAMAFAHDPALLLVFAFVSAVVENPFWSASGAAIPNLVEERDLSWANGLVQLGANAGIMVGPALGGLLVGFIGPSWVFGANALTFAVSAAMVSTVHGRFAEERTEEHEKHKGIRAGFVFLAREPVLRTMVLAWVALVLGMGVVMVADVPLAELFHAGSLGYGLMITSWGAGSVLGSLAGRFLNERKEPKALFLGMALIALSTAAISVSPWFAPILLMSFVSGCGDAVTLVAEKGIQQRRTPDVVRSRVMSAADAIVTVSYAISLAVSGLVLRAVGPQAVYAIGGLTAAVGTAVLFPVLRRARREAEMVVVPEAEALLSGTRLTGRSRP